MEEKNVLSDKLCLFLAWHSFFQARKVIPKKSMSEQPKSKDPKHNKNCSQRRSLLGCYIPLLVKEEAKFLVLVSSGALLTLHCSHVIPDDWDFH